MWEQSEHRDGKRNCIDTHIHGAVQGLSNGTFRRRRVSLSTTVD
jgi:hypothetical protein